MIFNINSDETYIKCVNGINGMITEDGYITIDASFKSNLEIEAIFEKDFELVNPRFKQAMFIPSEKLACCYFRACGESSLWVTALSVDLMMQRTGRNVKLTKSALYFSEFAD